MAFPSSYFGASLTDLLRQALLEDAGDGDHTSLSTVPDDLHAVGTVLFKQDGIAAGLEAAMTVAELVDQDIRIERLISDGDRVNKGTVGMQLTGKARSLLMAERLLLNCMQRMSGIASQTRQYVDAVAGTGCIVLDTRKTTPNFRVFEKWAVRIGGGSNHRYGLFDMILIKDNHVTAAGGIVPALERANRYLSETKRTLPIEIETRNLEEVQEALGHGGVQRIMLDNFSPERLREAIRLIDGRKETEASGGITLETVRSYAETGVDFISVGALTHSYHSLDISMKIRNL
ncbi:MAG: carboxylating nicotinate-nucleotide diphosphorylase [Bacteroidota bacterium]|jgi:nicotinate-nucleotide pyrophosphorylase (carboxylating)